MDIDSWMVEYKRICEELGILPKYDYDARDEASRIMGDAFQPLDRLENLIKNRDVIVFGAGPSLEDGVKNLERTGQTLIAADGAASCLLENGLYPEIVVTDLDGKGEDLLLANRFGAIMVVHAHGDNVPALRKLLPRLKNVVLSTQVEPLPNVHNFFGFTDGDRAVFLARHFGARGISLIGFDFDGTVGRYSDPKDPRDHKASERKRKKLGIAKRLLDGMVFD